jgi:hypothetical protein
MLAEHARKHLGGAGVVQQREQQVFDRDEFVPLLPGLDKGHMQADFKFLGNHWARPLGWVIEEAIVLDSKNG